MKRRGLLTHRVIKYNAFLRDMADYNSQITKNLCCRKYSIVKEYTLP